MSFRGLIKGITPKIRRLCFDLMNSVLLNLVGVCWKCCNLCCGVLIAQWLERSDHGPSKAHPQNHKEYKVRGA